MSRTLPEKIGAVVEALAEDLADWCAAGRDRRSAEHEEAVLERVRRVLPSLLWALGAEAIRRHAEAAGAALRAAEDAAVGQVEGTRVPAEALDPAPGFLVVRTDGATVRYRDGWHEVKLGLVAGWEGASCAPRATSPPASRRPPSGRGWRPKRRGAGRPRSPAGRAA